MDSHNHGSTGAKKHFGHHHWHHHDHVADHCQRTRKNLSPVASPDYLVQLVLLGMLMLMMEWMDMVLVVTLSNR